MTSLPSGPVVSHCRPLLRPAPCPVQKLGPSHSSETGFPPFGDSRRPGRPPSRPDRSPKDLPHKGSSLHDETLRPRGPRKDVPRESSVEAIFGPGGTYPLLRRRSCLGTLVSERREVLSPLEGRAAWGRGAGAGARAGRHRHVVRPLSG